ncbi:hypothetical protein BDR04DRAFT_689673 [Suillus decipiens]|nr:hypothetical protein BDR04DRAFT_689673 [Suillus decipiens]
MLSSAVVGLDPLPLLRTYFTYRDAIFPCQPALWLTKRRCHTDEKLVLTALISALWRCDVSATALAIAGTTPGLAGRWSSNAFRKYPRQHAFLLNALLYGSAREPYHSDT